MGPIEEAAPAKVNLTLHVTGRRADGYHLLDSLVVFADIGDVLRVAPAEVTRLSVTGLRAYGVPTGEENLVLKAARWLGCTGAEIELEKHLPAAAGIGGGSADAAAAIRALCRLEARSLPEASDALALGADVPVCLAGCSQRMRGIGERLDAVADLPPLPAVLVNPGVAVPTPAVFAALARVDNPHMEPLPDSVATPRDLASWLARQRNDLETPARGIAPVIGEALEALSATEENLLARMSGSGATCYGLYPSMEAAGRAAAAIAASRPSWWVASTLLAAWDKGMPDHR